jgi:predicted component of type VI protein secretion system
VRFRLRYLQHDLELTEGEFAVGRNASCQLSLDDPLVSRRHALLVVAGDVVTVEDLQSRNGVLVNGQRIQGRVRLERGDRILIGAQEMTLVAGEAATNALANRQTRAASLTLPKMQVAPSSAPPPDPRNYTPAAFGAVPSPGPMFPASRRPPPPSGVGGSSSNPIIPSDASNPDFELSMVRRADAFSLLGGVAEKALAMGRAVEAERILASPLGDVIEASRAGKRVTATLVDQAARFSAKLATATGKGAWADYVIELYATQRRPCPAPVIDELYNALRRVTAIDLQRLRQYIEDLRSRRHTFGPAERFLFQRLEGLERLAALR